MHGRLSSLAPLAICCLIAVSGCADSARSFNKFVSRPFKKTPEEELGIKTPQDRVDELRQLAKSAEKQSQAVQERVVAELAEEYRLESDAWVRREILRALANYPQNQAGAVLVDALGDAEVETRRVACAGLGTRGDAIAVQQLARVVGSETNVDVRLAAVEALGRTGDHSAVKPLVDVLTDPDPAMQWQTQQALAAASGRDYGNDVEAWREYAQTGKTDAAEVSFAEKLRRTFY